MPSNMYAYGHNHQEGIMQTNEELPDWTRGVPVTEAAKALNVSVDTIRRWADAGLIESYRTPTGHRRIVVNHETGAA